MVDIIDACVKESAYDHLLIDGLEAYLLDGAKNNKITKVEVYEEVFDKSPISSNQSFEVIMTQSDKSEQQEPQIEFKKLPKTLYMNF